MNHIILMLYQFLSIIIPGIIVMLLLSKRHRHKGIWTSLWHKIGVLVFAVYVFAVFYFTGVSTIYDLIRRGIDIRADQLNLTPFVDSLTSIQYLLNIALFVPLGFLLPLLWPQTNKLRYAVLYGFCFSLLIEVSQLFNIRATDVDDLIMNTAGAVLGYTLYRAGSFITGRDSGRSEGYKYEPALLIAVMFLGRFLLFDEFGLAKVLYGF